MTPSACSAPTSQTPATASYTTRGRRRAHARHSAVCTRFHVPRAWLQVLRPEALAPLRVKLGHIQGPEPMGIPGQAGHYMGQFNPSIVPAPEGLCPRCAYLVSLRIDPLHQCSRRSPLFTPPAGLPKKTPATAWFRNTALALLDAKFEVITWTWLLAAPHVQINPKWAHKNWTVGFGGSDGFRPPWTGQIYDVRLFNLHGRIFATNACAKCNFALMLITVTGDVTADGGLVHLRAWRQTAQRYISWQRWAQGRNQAIFAATRARDSQTVWQARGAGVCGGMAACATVYIQPWLGLVASFGSPAFTSTRYLCMSRRVKRPRGDTTKKGDVNVCGHTPLLQHLEIESVANPEQSSLRNFSDRPPPHPRNFRGRTWFGNTWPPSPPPPPPMPPMQANRFGRLELLHDETAHMALRRRKHRLSTTANLLHVAKRGADGKRCAALLGVGHTRRREGDCTVARQACFLFKKNVPYPFRYGYQYTHFFYTMEPHPPFRLLAASDEFCLSSAQDPSDCESVQFVSGINLEPSEPQWRKYAAPGADYELEARTLLLSYGINDCEAKLASLRLERVWAMLRPAEPGGRVCVVD